MFVLSGNFRCFTGCGGVGGEVVVVVVVGLWRYKTDPCPFIHEFEIRVYLNGYHWGVGMLLSAGSMSGIY